MLGGKGVTVTDTCHMQTYMEKGGTKGIVKGL